MNHNSIHKDLIFYIDNELSVEKRTAVEKHLEECADCRSFLSFLQEGLQIIEKEKKPEVSPFFYTRLSARLDEKPGNQVLCQLTRLLLPAFFSLVLLIGIYGGLRLGSNAFTPQVSKPAITGIQMINDFEAEPIESFLLSKL